MEVFQFQMMAKVASEVRRFRVLLFIVKSNLNESLSIIRPIWLGGGQ